MSQNKSQTEPRARFHHVGRPVDLRWRLRVRKIPCAASSIMIPRACISKNPNAPDSCHGVPPAVSPNRWKSPEITNVRVRTPYRARSVPLGSRITEKDRKLAGAENFWRAPWCQKVLWPSQFIYDRKRCDLYSLTPKTDGQTSTRSRNWTMVAIFQSVQGPMRWPR